MRVILLLLLATACFVVCHAAPQRNTNLQLGKNEGESVPVIEEVVVESTLNVRSPAGGRQARTNTRTSLQDGARVAEMKPKYVNYSQLN